MSLGRGLHNSMSLALLGHPRWPVAVKNSDKTCFINKKRVMKRGRKKDGCVKTAFLWMFTIGLLRPWYLG